MSPFDIAIAASGQALYRVVTAKGAPIPSIPAREDSRIVSAACRSVMDQYPGCYVEIVRVTIERRRFYRPRPQAARRDPFAIPPMPEGATA